jgi:hypothetical protein
MTNWLAKLVGILCLSSVLAAPADGVERKRNVFLITTDGLRWQEVFNGANEERIAAENSSTNAKARLREEFWRPSLEERRAALLPFLWGQVAVRGQIFGNRDKGSVARVTNRHHFSYPGYSEFLTGVADPRIDSNAKIPNPNTNVFEWLNGKREYRGKVAAACNWEVISWILNTGRNGIPIWTGFEPMPGSRSFAVPEMLRTIREGTTPLFADVTMDSFIALAAREHIRTKRPRAFYLAFGETDEWAHEGKYGHYLRAAQKVDRSIESLWNLTQKLPEYKDRTTFIITTDHGRGEGPDWTGHGASLAESAFIWIGIIGPETPALGERQNCALVTQNQLAATVAAALGENYEAAFPAAGPVLPGVFSKR